MGEAVVTAIFKNLRISLAPPSPFARRNCETANIQ